MRLTKIFSLGIAAIAFFAWLAISLSNTQATQVRNDSIGGVVTSSAGPEAGVWVIAETTDLPTRYIKGGGHRRSRPLPDSRSAQGQVHRLGARLRTGGFAQGRGRAGQAGRSEADRRAGCESRRAILSRQLLVRAAEGAREKRISRHGPPETAFRRTSRARASGFTSSRPIAANPATSSATNTRARFRRCSAISIPAASVDAARAIRTGRHRHDGRPELNLAPSEPPSCLAIGPRASQKGELPAEAPPRPQGVERNVVITQWDWADPKAYLHDEISTDKRNPNVNANGLIYGSPEESRDYLPVLDPVHNTISQVKVPYRDPNTPGQPKPLKPSAVWGDEAIWDSHTTVHNPMFDERGRVWFTARIRASDNPAFCKAGSSLISAKLTPVQNAPAANWRCTIRRPSRLSMIDTCFGTHHLLFAEDANNTLWTSSGGGGGVVGWLNTKMWDQTHDAAEVAGLDGAGAGHQRQRQARRLRGRRAEGGDRAERRKSGHVVRAQRDRRLRPRTRASTPRSMASRSAPTAWSGAACWVSRAASCG